MSRIVLTRIDSRLIHGQVMTKWLQQSQANRIVIINDELANDEFMRDIYLMSAPDGVRIDCLSNDEAVEKFKNEDFGDSKLLVLFGNLKATIALVKSGVQIPSIQIGGLGGAPNRKVVFQNITLDDDDAKIIKDLLAEGCDVYFQVIPEDNPQSAKSILEKYEK